MGIVKKQSIRSSIITYIGTLLGFVNFFYVLPHFLNQEQVGLIRILISFSLIVSQCSLLGVVLTVLRFFPRYNNKEKRHHGFLGFSLLVTAFGTAIFLLLLYVFKNPIEKWFEVKSALFVSNYFYSFPLIICMAFFEVFNAYSRSLLKTVVPTFLKEILLRVGNLAAIIIYILGWIDFQQFLVLFVSSYLLPVVVHLIYLEFLKQLFLFAQITFLDKSAKREISRYSVFTFVTLIAAVLVSNIDTVMVSSMSGLKATAVYSIGLMVGSIIQIPSRAVIQISVPIVSNAWSRNDISKIKEMYHKTALNNMLSGAMVFLLIWSCVNELLSFLPIAYSGAKWVIFVVAIGKFLEVLTGMSGEIIYTSRHSKFNLLLHLLLIVICFLMNYLLIPVWGNIGAAIATMMSLLLINLIRFIFLYATYKLQPFDLNNIKALLIVCGLTWLFTFIPVLVNVYLSIFLKGACILILLGGSIIFFKLSEDAISLWHQFQKGIRKFL